MTSRDPLPPVEDLVPHRGPSLLIQRILEASPGDLRAAGRISAANGFASSGTAPAYVAIDLLAQAAAALEQLARGEGVSAEDAMGYLVGIREARFEAPALPVGREVTAIVTRRAGIGRLAEYEARLVDGDNAQLSAVFSTLRRDPRRPTP